MDNPTVTVTMTVTRIGNISARMVDRSDDALVDLTMPEGGGCEGFLKIRVPAAKRGALALGQAVTLELSI